MSDAICFHCIEFVYGWWDFYLFIFFSWVWVLLLYPNGINCPGSMVCSTALCLWMKCLKPQIIPGSVDVFGVFSLTLTNQQWWTFSLTALATISNTSSTDNSEKDFQFSFVLHSFSISYITLLETLNEHLVHLWFCPFQFSKSLGPRFQSGINSYSKFALIFLCIQHLTDSHADRNCACNLTCPWRPRSL